MQERIRRDSAWQSIRLFLLAAILVGGGLGLMLFLDGSASTSTARVSAAAR